MATYYVSTSGLDTNAGTLGSPFRNISYGVSRLFPGDTLLIRGGTYNDTIDSSVSTVRSGTSGSPITISAYPGGLGFSRTPGPRPGAEVVIMQPSWGSKGICLTVGGPSYLTFQDIVIDQSTQTVGDAGNGPNGVFVSTSANHNIFLHLEVKNTAGGGFGLSQNNGSADSQQILYCLIHHNGLDSSAANNGYGIYGNTSGNIIDGNDVYENHGYGIQFNSAPSNNIVRNNRVHHNYPWNAGGVGGHTGGGITFQGDAAFNPIGHINGNQIYNNIVYDNGFATGAAGIGIQVYVYTRGTLVYNNTVYHNNGDGISLQYYDSTVPPIIRNNIVYANLGHPIWDYGDLNGATGSPTIDHNLLTDPSFADVSSVNFSLQPGSAARDFGMTLALVTTDIVGVSRPQGSQYDAGAYEYPASVVASLPIVPNAPTGYGMDTRAAYQGGNPTIYRVTKLTDDGSVGTLRYALEASGNRMVIFETSGYIDLTSDLNITSPCISVCGQTAPFPGICVRNYGLGVLTNDVYLSHFAVRPGGDTCNAGLQAYSGTQTNVVLDHMSFTWGQDENIGFNRVNNANQVAVVWRCIMAEGLWAAPGTSGCTGGGTSNGHGILVSADCGHVAILQSLFANNIERNPYMQSGTNTAIVNNLIYQWHGPWGFFYNNADVNSTPNNPGGPWHSTAIGNRFVKGPHTTDAGDPNAYIFNYSINTFGEALGNSIYKADNTVANPDSTIIYESNQYSYDPNVGSPPSQTPLPTGMAVLGSTSVEAFVLANVGATPAQRQAVDARIVNDVSTRSGNFINHPNVVGGYPAMSVISRPLTTPSNPHVVQSDGYTTLEKWVHGYSAAVEGVLQAPPDATGTVFVQDTFTGPAGQDSLSHTGEIGASYSNATGITGLMALTNLGRLRTNSSGVLATIVPTGIPLSAQYDVAFDFYIATLEPNEAIAIWIKFDPATISGYQLRYDTDNVAFELYLAVNNVFTFLGSYPYNQPPGTTAHCRFKGRNTGQFVKIDGIDAISTPDTSIAGPGRIAYAAFANVADSAATGVQIDNVVATDMLSGGTRLNGIQATTALGAVGKNITRALTGVSATTALGTMGKVRSVALTGLVGIGLLGAFGNSNVSTGVSAQVQLGSVGFVRSAALNGVQASGFTGAIGIAQVGQVGLTGVSAQSSLGLLTPDVSKTLSGHVATTSVGNVGTGQNVVALTGVQANSALGSVRVPGDVIVALSGVVGRTSLNYVKPPGVTVIDQVSNTSRTFFPDFLTIGGAWRQILSGTPWSVTDTQNNNGTMRFNVSSEDGTYVPDYDDEVIFNQNGVRIFGGYVSTFRIRGAGDEAGTPIFTEVSCVDYNSLAGRRYYHETLVEGTLKSMLQLVVPYCPGVTLDPTQVTGPTLGPADYKGWKPVDIFNQFTQRTGYIWRINYFKVFEMYLPSKYVAPFSITTANGLAKGDVSCEPSRREYANRIIVYGKGVTVSAQDASQIERYGYYELAYNTQDVEDAVQLQAMADTILTQTLPVLRTAKYVTYESGLASGMTQTIDLPGRKINNTFLLTEVISTYTAPYVVRKNVTAIEGLVFKAGWRDTYKQWGGAGAGATSVGSGGPSGVGAQVQRFAYPIGGNGIEMTRNDTGVAWVPAAGGSQQIGQSSMQAQINTIPRGTTDALVVVRMRTFTPGVSVQARLFDVTVAAACPGVSAPVTSQTWTTVEFATSLTPGSHFYELQLLPSVAGEDVAATGYVE